MTRERLVTRPRQREVGVGRGLSDLELGLRDVRRERKLVEDSLVIPVHLWIVHTRDHRGRKGHGETGQVGQGFTWQKAIDLHRFVVV